MKPSNTSHSEISFGGVLQPFVEALGRVPRGQDKLAGQEIAISRNDIQAFIAVDAQENIHLLLSAVSNDTRFTRLDLRGLKIVERDWSVAGNPIKRYLDVSCETGSLPSFRRPFLRFAEDVLFEISKPAAIPADAVYRTGVRWRHFWSADSTGAVTVEWLHGIFGELSFLFEIMERFGPSVVHSWCGPLGRDQDFQSNSNSLGVEIKTSTEIPFRIHCNIRQMDPAIFPKLYLVCYRLTASETGETIPDIVLKIENLIGSDEAALEIFYERLVAAGYRRELELVYKETPLNCGPAVAFHVDNDFPKITETSFTEAPDHRISNIRYTLQLTGLKEFTIDTISHDLSQLINDGGAHV